MPIVPSRPLRVAGVDEAGRGPLAGPVVIAAVILDARRPIDGLADSKVLCAERRDELEVQIRACARAFAVSVIEVDVIDRINILQATLLGMTQVLCELMPRPELALIDGNRLPVALPCTGHAIIDGDAREPAISAASILAKTARDRLMCALDAAHPGYGFARHKGYATPEHVEALERLGPCAIHRRSFAPVARLIEPGLPFLFEPA